MSVSLSRYYNNRSFEPGKIANAFRNVLSSFGLNDSAISVTASYRILDEGDESRQISFDEIGSICELRDRPKSLSTGFNLPSGFHFLFLSTIGNFLNLQVQTPTVETASKACNDFEGELALIRAYPQIGEGDHTEEKLQGYPRISVLFLAADPTDASRLRLGEELREIQEKLQLAKLREQFGLYQRMSVRPADISQALLDVQPRIVHFSGHGTATGAFCFENQVGQTHPIQPDALAALFEQFANQVNCVVLNGCYSETQANAIAKHIDYVIGMNQAIGDKAAIAFAIGFYQALGAGRTIEDAYKLGCVQIRLQGIPEHLTPVLIKKGVTQP